VCSRGSRRDETAGVSMPSTALPSAFRWPAQIASVSYLVGNPVRRPALWKSATDLTDRFIIMWKYGFIFVVAAIVSAAFCPLAERIALRAGAIDHPGGRHIHQRPTARLGGIAVGLGLLSSILIAAAADPFVNATLAAHLREFILLGAGAGLMLLVGAIDDFCPIRPSIKLLAEIVAALVVVSAGHQIQFAFGLNLGWLRSVVTVLWITAIMNAINMVDGLDGLAGGVSLIIGMTLFAVSLYLGSATSGIILIALCGGLAGFLPFNFSPAKIFLGDSGSLLIGYGLGVTAIQSSSKAATVVAIVVPLLALGLPLAELLTTAVRRVLRMVHVVRWDVESRRYEFFFLGRPALFTADRDHIHHRLLALGLGPRRTVLLLYGACAVFGAGAFLMVTFEGANLALLLATFLILAMACLRQLQYGELRPLRTGLFLPVFDSILTNRRIVQGVVDLGSAMISIGVAYLIYDGGFTNGTRTSIHDDAPLIVLIQIACLAVSGLYRRAFRQSGIPDLLAVMKALVVAILSSWIASLVLLDRPVALSVSVLDAYLLITLVAASRFSFLLLDHIFKSARTGKRRVLIYGAGTGGAAACRQIQSSPELDMQVVGFLDDDARRTGQLLNGVPVHCDEELDRMIDRREFDEAILAKPLSADRARNLAEICAAAEIRLSRYVVEFEEMREPLSSEIRRRAESVNDILFTAK
jgi:UDP-GlcNAc:undecaprenyl-phosphate GlcNAc-1-phosphate transferase